MLHLREGGGIVAPAGSVDDDTAEAAGDDASDGEGDDPAHVDPGDHAPVDGSPGTGAQTNTDGSTSDALGGGDGELCSLMVSTGLASWRGAEATY